MIAVKVVRLQVLRVVELAEMPVAEEKADVSRVKKWSSEDAVSAYSSLSSCWICRRGVAPVTAVTQNGDDGVSRAQLPRDLHCADAVHCG
jgi:hypothetical protein